MIFGDLLKKIAWNALMVVTALAYIDDTNEYYSFRTVYDHKTAKYIRDIESGWLGEIYNAEVKSIDIRENILWVDVLEYLPRSILED